MEDQSNRTGLARTLRKKATLSERILWRELRDRKAMGLKFRRQTPIGPYIVDFYCAEHKVIIELDGGTHPYRAVYEKKREEFLVEQGMKVLHLRNHDVVSAPDWAVKRILTFCGVAEFEHW